MEENKYTTSICIRLSREEKERADYLHPAYTQHDIFMAGLSSIEINEELKDGNKF